MLYFIVNLTHSLNNDCDLEQGKQIGTLQELDNIDIMSKGITYIVQQNSINVARQINKQER